jgi:hypothetical protein
MNSLPLGRIAAGHIRLPVSGNALPLVARVRFQLLGGLLICVVLPSLLRGQFVFGGQSPATAVNAGIGSCMAIVVGYYFMRRISSVPGVQSGARTLFAISAPYALVLAGFLLLRLDYSRFVLVSSYVAALCWFSAVHLAARAALRPELAVIPGGHAERLVGIAHVRWRKLQAPPENLDGIAGVVADLRQDLSAQWQRFLADCTVEGVPVFHSKQVHESLTGKVDVEHLSESGFGSLLPSLAYVKVKQMVDRGLALVLLPAFAMTVLLVAPLIVLESGRPVLFSAGTRGPSRPDHQGLQVPYHERRRTEAGRPPCGNDRRRRRTDHEGGALAAPLSH